MSEMDTPKAPETAAPDSSRFTLSEALSDRLERFETPEDAARAFSSAEAANRPMVVERINDAARKLATTVQIGDEIHKSVPPLAQLRSDPAYVDDAGQPKDERAQSTLTFWTAYHAREAEKQNSAVAILEQQSAMRQAADETGPNRTADGDDAGHGSNTGKDGALTSSVSPKSVTKHQDGSLEPAVTAKQMRDLRSFDMPNSIADRFVITKSKDRQEFFRSYDDPRPAIVDRGDQLSTKNADRGTAMDMIELAEHRGWQSLRAKGPEEFRREMWIEGRAHGLKVEGYRPSEKDLEESRRRSEMVQTRMIERLDRTGGTGSAANREAQAQEQSARRTTQDADKQAQTVNFSEGVSGTIAEIGAAPYKGKDGAEPVPFVRLEMSGGREQTLWSVTLTDAIEKHDLAPGDRATFYSPGVEAVTYTSKDRQTGEEVQREGHRRIWEARDIERVMDVTPAKAQGSDTGTVTDGTGGSDMAETQRAQDTAHDRLEDRIKSYEPGDTPVRGAASALARMEAEMRAAGVSEADREAARDEASKLLAQGVSKGVSYPVQTLPNVSKEQIAQARDVGRQGVEVSGTGDREREKEGAGLEMRER